MKILGIDTSSAVLGIGVTDGDSVLGELVQNKALTHSERLMPHIAYLMDAIDEKLSDMDFFAVTIGPGSFTGIRIGVATANAFALVNEKRVIGISTLEALAYNFKNQDLLIITTMYAQRDDYYRGIYEFRQSGQACDLKLHVLEPEAAVSREEILEEAVRYAKGRNVLIAGEITGKISDEIDKINLNKDLCDGIIKTAGKEDNYIRPGILCVIAAERSQKAEKYAEPVYIRKPQAEVQYEEMQKQRVNHGN